MVEVQYRKAVFVLPLYLRVRSRIRRIVHINWQLPSYAKWRELPHHEFVDFETVIAVSTTI